MLEMMMIGASVVIMFRAANMEQESGMLWGGGTFLLCVIMIVLFPGYPLIRIGCVVPIMFGIWLTWRIMQHNKRRRD